MNIHVKVYLTSYFITVIVIHTLMIIKIVSDIMNYIIYVLLLRILIVPVFIDINVL